MFCLQIDTGKAESSACLCFFSIAFCSKSSYARVAYFEVAYFEPLQFTSKSKLICRSDAIKVVTILG